MNTQQSEAKIAPATLEQASQDSLRPKLSVILIMHNESHNIADCLDSVHFADEWIVVDSGSSDNSVEIAKAKGAKVIHQAWLGFGPQKNVALSHATGEWILSIDADERITPVLASEIQHVISSAHNKYDAYEIPRLSQYCGKEIYRSGWWPDNVLRLFKSGTGVFSDDVVHERIIVNSPIGKLNHYMQHISYRKIEEVLHKVNSYSTAGAEKLLTRNKKISFTSALTHGFWAFFRSYFIQRGFLDGKHGLMLAISNAEGTYYRYLKAWFAQQQSISPKPSIALIITTYNRPSALRLVLESILLQSVFPREIIVADDGSRQETQQLIEEYQAKFNGTLKHVWQEDNGFRAAAIRNKAALESSSDYIVYIDGDCILPPNFIRNHRDLAEKGFFVASSRVLISENYTNELEKTKNFASLFNITHLIKLRATKKINRILPAICISPNASWRKKSPLKWQSARTCNLGLWRTDLINIDGFDEAFEGWGMEDSDLVIRLQHSGIFHKNGRFYSTVFHLWHKENDRSKLAENQARLNELLKSNKIKAEKGLSAYQTSECDNQNQSQKNTQQNISDPAQNEVNHV